MKATFKPLINTLGHLKQYIQPAGAVAVVGAIVLAGMSIHSPRVHADEGNNEESKIQQGLAIAPVPLNLKGKDRSLVGLGSYIVNAQADCNGCHTLNPGVEYTPPGNPYLLAPPDGPFSGKVVVDPTTYLAGGRDFGPFPDSSGIPHLYSRNLTPDYTGLPEGGHTFSDFMQIMRHGRDFDLTHPRCTAPNTSLQLPRAAVRRESAPGDAMADPYEHDGSRSARNLHVLECGSMQPGTVRTRFQVVSTERVQ